MDKVIRNFTMTLFLAALLNGQAEAQERIITLELNQGLAQLKQTADDDLKVKVALDALARQVPEISQTLRQLANDSQVEINDQARYGLYRQFFVDAKTLSSAQVAQTVQNLRANSLVKAAMSQTLDERPEADPGPPVSFKRNTVYPRPPYLLSPHPLAGNRVGGINSDAVRDMPGGRGDFARVIIASESFWDPNHSGLPARPFHPMRAPQRLACGLYWGVGNSGTQAAGIIADKHLGIVPAAQLTATPSSWRGGIYFTDIHDAGLKRGDVVVIDALTNENATYHYPGAVCPGGTVCTLPLALSAADGNVLASYTREIEYLTEIKGVHVVINAGGGTKMLAESWQPQFPGRYMPINLDNPDLQGNFDRRRNDDGSILVGSINPVTGTAVGANYGERVDVSTWATNIQSAAYQPGVKDLYARYDAQNPLAYRFSAWIVAGAVAQIQSIAFAHGLGPVPTKVMRQLLVDTGRDFANPTPDMHRGRQPDVKAAVDKMLTAYANGFPPDPIGPTIKRIEGPGFAAGDRGSSFGGARSNTTVTYTPVLSQAAKGVTFDWKVAPPLIKRSVDPVTGTLQVDAPARAGAYWHPPTPPTAYVTLTTHDASGAVDTLSRSSSIVGVYTSDKAYSATWNVPDEAIAGQALSLTVTPKPYANDGYQIRWLAPELFNGIQEKTATNSPYTLTVNVPHVTKDTPIKVEVGGTLQNPLPSAPIGSGFYLSKMVLVRATPPAAEPLTGTLTAPRSVVGGKEVLFSTQVNNDQGADLKYVWTLTPAGFAGATHQAAFTGFAPSVNQETPGQVEVLITNAKGQQLRLAQPLTVSANLPRVSLLGPDSVGAGDTFTLTAQATNPTGGTLRFSWRIVPAILSGTVSNSPTLTLKAPAVTQPTTAVVSVNAGVGMNQATASKTVTITPRH